jgi:ribosomal protein S18 acetylase RimI-like enzyme
MSSLDLIARHYLLRTTNNTIHPIIDTPSVRSTRFTDGEGTCWLFLQLSRYSLDVRQGTARVGGDSESIGKGMGRDGKEDQERDKDGDVQKEELVELLMQHCAAPRWSINLEFDIPNTHDTPEPESDQDLEQFLHRIIPKKMGATMDRVESMFLDPTHTTNKEGMASNKAGLGGFSGLEAWEIRDGRTWFSKAFPSRVALVEHEKVWMVMRGRKNELDGVVEDEVGGYITTLSDPEIKEVTMDNGNGRNRVYISSLFAYPSHRRKGLGRALLQHVIARAKASPRGPSLVCLTVFCTNTAARGMYLVEGFVVTRRLWVIRSGRVASG